MFTKLERHQVLFYFLCMFFGVCVAWVQPSSVLVFEFSSTPLLMFLLYLTFLGVPFLSLLQGVRDYRFLGVLFLCNFVFVPVVVWFLSFLVTFDDGLVLGVCLVLLTPCVDYVLVFSRLAGGDWQRLLAASPLLMLLQIVLLPLYLFVFVGDVVVNIDWYPFGEAFLLFIVLPLSVAVFTNFLASRFEFFDVLVKFFEKLMVPVMGAVLFCIVGSQFSSIVSSFSRLVYVFFVFVLFVVFVGCGAYFLSGKFGFEIRRVIVFSSVTRNSLVVLPIALSLSKVFPVVALVVVSQTLVELVCMVLLVRFIPRFIK